MQQEIILLLQAQDYEQAATLAGKLPVEEIAELLNQIERL